MSQNINPNILNANPMIPQQGLNTIVKGVPGCKRCHGSGWKRLGKHPHPCHKCAKLSTPTADVPMLGMVGVSNACAITPLVDSIPIKKTIPVTEMVETTETIPVTKHVNITKQIPVKKNIKYTENIQVKETVPVTKQVEITKTIPVKRDVKTIENVQIKEQVPITTFQNITKEVPVTKTKKVIENVEVKEMIPMKQNVEVIKNVPVTKTKLITETVPQKIKVPYTEEVEITKMIPQTKYVTVTDEADVITKVTTQTPTFAGSFTPEYLTQIQITGIPECKKCQGFGYRKSKLNHNILKACEDCVKETQKCIICNNTGMRLDTSQKCNCHFAA
jgi:hypothetical protein